MPPAEARAAGASKSDIKGGGSRQDIDGDGGERDERGGGRAREKDRQEDGSKKSKRHKEERDG
eukprot:scaffold158871_cov15-Tisochrysis_lutea.AAC.2